MASGVWANPNISSDPHLFGSNMILLLNPVSSICSLVHCIISYTLEIDCALVYNCSCRVVLHVWFCVRVLHNVILRGKPSYTFLSYFSCQSIIILTSSTYSNSRCLYLVFIDNQMESRRAKNNLILLQLRWFKKKSAQFSNSTDPKTHRVTKSLLSRAESLPSPGDKERPSCW